MLKFHCVVCRYLSALCLALASPLCSGGEPHRPSLWIDAYEGEPVTYDEVVADLAKARVIYLGERHTVQRHHDQQAQIVADLAKQGVPLVVGMEQLEATQQPLVDKFNRKEFDFEKLTEATQWAKRWPNYQQYSPVLEAAQKAGAKVLGLNARSETIRQVARLGGVEKLSAEARQGLPADMQLQDPLYEKLLRMQLAVHVAATPERMHSMIEAQMARDETMAATLTAYLKSEPGRKRTAVVLCGAGHAMYGLAMVQAVRRRMPGVHDRIVLFSESGDVKLSPEEKAAARPIEITHEQLREVNRPVGDYLHVMGLPANPPEVKFR
jgi:uncharacterized iron-regulated protein